VWSSLLRGRSQQSRLLAIRPDGTQLVISDRQTDIAALKAGRLVGSETISLTDSLSGEPIIVLAESELYGGPAAYSADGKRLALRAIVAPEGGAAPLWSRLCVHDAGSGRFVRAFDIALQESVARGIALNSNGTLIAVSPGPVNGNASGSDGELLFTVLDVESGATVCCAKERGARGCRSLAFASDSGRIVSISGYNALCVWDASNGQLLGTVRGHDGRVNAAVFSPDGARIVSAGEDGTLRVWDSASFELLLTIRQHTTPIHGIAYSPDGMRIVSAGDDGVRLFDARPRKQILAGLDTPPYGENAR
jgi:WD40 repeat protein